MGSSSRTVQFLEARNTSSSAMRDLGVSFIVAVAVQFCFGGVTDFFQSTSNLQQPLGGVKNLKQLPQCEKYVQNCRDEDSYPNIAQGFRGYNPIKGDPFSLAADSGYEAPIFDENTERDGANRFGNVAGNDLNRCDGKVQADFLQTVEEFFSSVTTSEGDNSGFHVGPELDISAGIGKKGVQATVDRKVPHIAESVGSSSNIMTEISKSLTSHNRMVTRSRFNCYEYEFEIKDTHHPMFTEQFKTASKSLETCLKTAGQNQILEYSVKNPATDECVKTFFENYGTHYIKKASFGSKMSVLTVLEGEVLNTANGNTLRECAAENTKWSFLGLFGGGKQSQTCQNTVFGENSASANMIYDQKQVTVGSTPKSDYFEWAADKGNPEIVTKTIVPISDLFTQFFMSQKLVAHPHTIPAANIPKMQVLLENYVDDYCELYPEQCNHVTKKFFCPDSHNPKMFSPCACKPEEQNCGRYTGPVDTDFLPNGEGSLVMNGVEKKVKFNHGVAAELLGHGAKITELIAKTANRKDAECDKCNVYATICDAQNNCCDAGDLNTQHDDFLRGEMDLFTSIGACQGFSVDPTHDLTMTVRHNQKDAWYGDWIRVILSNGMYKTCTIGRELDNSESMVATCK